MNARLRLWRTRIVVFGALMWGSIGAILGWIGVLEGQRLGGWTLHLGGPGAPGAIHGAIYGAILGSILTFINTTLCWSIASRSR